MFNIYSILVFRGSYGQVLQHVLSLGKFEHGCLSFLFQLAAEKEKASVQRARAASVDHHVSYIQSALIILINWTN